MLKFTNGSNLQKWIDAVEAIEDESSASFREAFEILNDYASENNLTIDDVIREEFEEDDCGDCHDCDDDENYSVIDYDDDDFIELLSFDMSSRNRVRIPANIIDEISKGSYTVKLWNDIVNDATYIFNDDYENDGIDDSEYTRLTIEKDGSVRTSHLCGTHEKCEVLDAELNHTKGYIKINA